MRAFLISTFFFTLCVALIVSNSIYLHNITDEMLAEIDSLSDSENESAEAMHTLTQLSDKWNNLRDRIALTVSYDYIASITLSLNSTREFLRGGNMGEYYAGTAALREAVLRLHELEKFSIKNIV